MYNAEKIEALIEKQDKHLDNIIFAFDDYITNLEDELLKIWSHE